MTDTKITTDDVIAHLTQQRDRAEKIAREAINRLEETANRADAAERMVCEIGAIISSRRPDPDSGLSADAAVDVLDDIDAALASTAEVAGRWVHEDEIVGVEMVDRMRAERDAAIAARDEAVRDRDDYEKAFRVSEIRVQRLLLERANDARDAIRARDEVGIQLAAAQARIKLLEEGVDLLRHIDEFKGEPKWGPNGINTYRVSCDVIDIGVGCFLARLDAVPGDALAPVVRGAPFDEAGTVNQDKKGGE